MTDGAGDDLGSHPCFMPTCERIAHSQWAICGSCYRLLPHKLRQQIARAFVPGMTWETATGGMRTAIAAARAWVIETFGNGAREPDPSRWERLKRYVREKDEARRAARAAGQPIPVRPRCPSPGCPCAECVVEYGSV